MRPPAIRIEALPAGYGDMLLVTCRRAAGEWRLLVDCGPDECWPTLRERLAGLPPDAAGRRHIDLAIISHIDHDHIGAAHALFDDRSLGLSFGDVWFNAPPPSRGVAEGRSLALLLGASDSALPWNLAFNGRPAVVPAGAHFVELPAAAGDPKLTLLSPTNATLATLFKVWDAELKKLKTPEPRQERGSVRGADASDLEAMAERTTSNDRAPANGSSIALLLEHQGASVLLGADAFAPVLADALQALAAHRNARLPMRFDVFKLSHHGSRANITRALLEACQARHYIVSTSGAIFGHPDEEAIARVVVHGGKGATVWFNHRTEHTARWAAPELVARYGYGAKLPAARSGTVAISIKGVQPR